MSITKSSLLAGAAMALLAPLAVAGTAGASAAGRGPAASAAGRTTATDRLLTETSASGRVEAGGDQVVGRVNHDGHSLIFVEHTAIGTIGVYESAPLGEAPYLTALRDSSAQGSGSTALELYRTLSTKAPPAALVLDHERRGGSTVESIVLPSSQGDDPTDGSCTYNEAFAYDSEWAWNWHSGLGQQHDLHAELSFFDDINGNVGRNFDANRSSARWLAACNGDHLHGFSSIYLRPDSLVNGVWTKHFQVHVEPYTQEIYWSAGGPERWRLHMSEAVGYNVQNLRNWAIGGAIDKPFGLAANGG